MDGYQIDPQMVGAAANPDADFSAPSDDPMLRQKLLAIMLAGKSKQPQGTQMVNGFAVPGNVMSAYLNKGPNGLFGNPTTPPVSG